MITTLTPPGYDIIPDLHADLGRLTRTLTALGYAPAGGVWQHPEGRAAAFLGDYIDPLAKASPGAQHDSRGVIALVRAGELNNKLARQVVDGVLAGEGDPDHVVATRGLAVVSDDTALIAAVDEALAAQPDVAEKIRGGKVAAAGAIVGAVMKATRGQADAKRVRELVLERCG